MDEYLEAKFQGTAAPTTLKKRIRFLKRISDGATDIGFLNDTDRIIDILDGYKNVSTRWTNAMHIVMAMKLDPTLITDASRAIYDRYLAPLRDAAIGHITDNTMTERESRLLDTTLIDEQARLRGIINDFFESYGLKYKALTKANAKKIDIRKFAHDFQQIMYVGVYLFQPALRSNYGSMRITTRSTRLDKSYNYLYKRGGVMAILMYNYKNHASMGDVRIPAHPEFKDLINVWLSVLKLITSNPIGLLHYKIPKDTKNKVSWIGNDDTLQPQLSRISNTLLGRDFNINGFRKLWETAIQTSPDYQKLNIHAKEEIHKEMLHMKTTAELYHRKN